MIRWILKGALLGLAFYFIPDFCHRQTDGFMISNITSKHPYDKRFEVNNPPLIDVFSKPFTYLGSGGQAYAFVSEDQKYVLKFFKQHHHIPQFWQHFLPGLKKRQMKREKKYLRDFQSYKLSIELLPEETGLLYVHLNPSRDLKKTACIIDKLNIAHQIDLDRFDFILQKKATLAYEYFDSLIEKKDVKGLQTAIISFCDLVVSRLEKGIYDEDPKIHRNVGFVDSRPILIDVGRLKPDKREAGPDTQKEDLEKILAPLKTYLKEKSPQSIPILDDYLETL